MGDARGYYIDMTIKAPEIGRPPVWPEARLHVKTCQWGLGCYDRYLAGEGRAWLDSALEAGRYLASIQLRDGERRGGLLHREPYPDTFSVGPNWLSGMAQGQAASLLTRLHRETGDETFAEAAIDALGPMRLPSRRGGVQATLGGEPLPEEYPTEPPSHVLNGAIFAAWGQYDVWQSLSDEQAGADFARTVSALTANIRRWDAGYWSRYDLLPRTIPNLASAWYHRLHISQLRVMERIAPDPAFTESRARFEAYERSRLAASRAFLQKVVFRLLTPRHPS